MNLYVFALRDIKADVYGTPYFSPNVGSAIRSFGDEINRQDANNLLWKHPSDFELYLLGTYDDSCGAFLLDKPKQVAVGSNMVIQEKSK